MDHQDRDIMQHSDTAASNALVTIIIVDARASGQANAIHKCAGHIRHHNDTEVDIIGIGIDKYLSPGTEPPLHIAQDINEAVQRCHTPWVMLCDSSTRLVDHALDRLVATATERGANAVIAGLDEPNESIFTLQGKLFATSALQDIDLSDCDVWDDGYITLQHIMAKARNVAGIGENLFDSADLTHVAKSLTPAHNELLYRMGTLYCEIQLCDRCNLDCAYCSHLSPISQPVRIDLDTLKDECHRLAKIGFDEVNLMGGEPLLHPQVIEAIQITRSILPDIKLIVSTNGLLLPRMTREFWQCCRDNKVVLRITPYPRAKGGTWNYFKYLYLIKKNHVRMESTGWRFGFRHQLLSEKAEFDATSNYLRCQLHCTQVRDATLWPCAYVAYAFNLNNKFGTNFKHAAGDSLPLTDDTTATDVRLWLLRTKPFCSHCGITNAKHVNWKRSEYARSEWLQD